MKALLILLSLFFAGCQTDCISQLPDQFVYTDVYCRAQLPNYTTKVKATGGCTGYTITQTPSPGTVLSVTNKSILVTLKVTGANGKFSQESFTVTLADTVTPRITNLITSVDDLLQKSRVLYDAADRTLGQIDSVFSTGVLVVASWDSAGTRKRFVTYTDTFDLGILK